LTVGVVPASARSANFVDPGDRRWAPRVGVTLIELLVVIVVIGVLASVAVPRLVAARYEAFEASARSDLRNLLSAQELHHSREGEYSEALEVLGFRPSEGVLLEVTFASATGWAAVATHTGFPSGECGIFVGSAGLAAGGGATQPGSVTCSR
jgi:prepilin-type N-terminal cleavage/methylation domain-containing protein